MDCPEFLPIEWVKQETEDTVTMCLSSKDKPRPFQPGQYSMLYAFGYGESALSLSGDPDKHHELIYTIKSVGNVTQALCRMKQGDLVGVRGPYGSRFPLQHGGYDAIIIAGGVGIATLRSLIYQISSNRNHFSKVTVLYGAKSLDTLVYQDEWSLWKENGIDIVISLDSYDTSWQGKKGVITEHITPYVSKIDKTLIFCCGPGIMLLSVMERLKILGVFERNIFFSLERNMQCAQKLCGRCQLGPFFLCKDGPVLSLDKIKHLLKVKEL